MKPQSTRRFVINQLLLDDKDQIAAFDEMQRLLTDAFLNNIRIEDHIDRFEALRKRIGGAAPAGEKSATDADTE